MDSFFDILIIFVIIFSIINSLFAKKKKTSGEAESKEKKKTDAADLLEQLFGVPSEKKKPEYYGEQNEPQTWNPEEEYQDTVVEPVASTSFKELPEKKKAKDIEFRPLKKDYKLDDIIAKKETISKRSSKQKELISKLRNPKSLKDFVIAAEIINKPKALND